MTAVDLNDRDAFRRAVAAWLDDHLATLTPRRDALATLDDDIAHWRHVRAALYAAGWGRYGWPSSVGGLGGSPMLRAIVAEEVTFRDLCNPQPWSMIEVLAPTVMTFGRPEVVFPAVEGFMRGDEMWSQGFSEPGTGSDLASLSCRATPVDGGWIVNGQKVWTSFIQYASRVVLLTRTGEPGSAHRGITALFVDADSPGIEYRPIEIINGRHEFAEVFFDDVFVPAERLLGEVDGGWAIAMDLLPYERSTTFWHRGVHLHQRFDRLLEAVDTADDDTATLKALGEAYQSLMAFRCRSRSTQHRLDAGETLSAETSIDKILIAGAEQQLFDTARDLLDGEVEFGSGALANAWREEFLYSRSATIYGGTAEIQRNIVARRLLNLGAES